MPIYLRPNGLKHSWSSNPSAQSPRLPRAWQKHGVLAWATGWVSPSSGGLVGPMTAMLDGRIGMLMLLTGAG